MSAPEPGKVTHISDTARWVAMYRAMESERPDALFEDRWARALAGPEGEAILQGMPKGRQMAWPMIVRTHLMDEILLRTIKAESVDTVLNLASGLDVRPYRLDLPASLRWIDADLPGILSHKEQHMAGEPPRCKLEFVQADLTNDDVRQGLFTRVGASSKRVFVITEGLIAYLKADQVASLASALGAQASFRWWLIDLASPDLLKRMESMWGKALQSSPLIFGPEEGTQFFAPYGWQEKEYRSMFDESIRLNRTMPFAKLFRFMGRLAPKKKREKFKRFSGVVLLERK